MKPAPRLTIHPMTDHDAAEAILTGIGKDLAAFASIILAMGGAYLTLLAFAAH